MSGFEREKAGHHARGATAAAPASEPAGVQAVDHALADGARDPAAMRAIVEQFPADRDAMLARLHATAGNAFVQAMLAVPAASLERERDEVGAATALDAAVRATLVPAFHRAVDALDPAAAAELGARILGLVGASAGAERDAAAALDRGVGGAMTSSPGAPIADTPGAAANRFTHLAVEHGTLRIEQHALYRELAIALSPQRFRGQLVMGALAEPNLGKDPLAAIESEVTTTVMLVGAIARVRELSGGAATSAQLDAARRAEIAAQIEPWHGRPVSFAFLQHALDALGLWSELEGATGPSGRTLAQTAARAAAQAKLTGALADVDDFDAARISALLPDGEIAAAQPVDPRVHHEPPEEVADELYEQIMAAAPNARGQIVRLLERRGRFQTFCESLPWQAVQRLRAAIAPFDTHVATILGTYVKAQGGGESLHAMYEGAADNALADGHGARAFGWIFLEHLHNTVTGGFERAYSDAYDAREAGLISTGEFHREAVNALGKSALITAASIAAGGAAGEWLAGAAAPLGQDVASFAGGLGGGAAGGVAGHLTGDVYGQLAEGKSGFDSLGAYATSAATGAFVGGATAAATSGLTVMAARYLGYDAAGASARLADVYAARYPRFTRFLEAARKAGVGSRVRMTAKVSELIELISQLGPPSDGGGLAYAGIGDLRSLPPDTTVQFSIRPHLDLNRPLQMSANSNRDGDAQSPLEVDDIAIASDASGITSEPANVAAPESELASTRDAANARPPERHGEPILWVDPSQLVVSDRATAEEWTASIEAPLANGKTPLIVSATVLLDAEGKPVGGPSFLIDRRVRFDGKDCRIYIGNQATGETMSLTDLALDRTIAAFEERFGHPPDELPGSLAFENKANFQRQYLRAIDSGESPMEATITAVRAVSFGRARASRGYDVFEVDTTGSEIIPYGDPPQPRTVPSHIDVKARRK